MTNKTNNKSITQIDIIKEYFIKHSREEIKHPQVVNWAMSKWEKRTGEKFRDPDRAIRKLHQQGFLQKIGKGIYCYNPDYTYNREDLEDFSPLQKKQILERDNYKCVICGMGKKDGVELHIDHIKPKDFGGKATLENGQTLCARHNFLKKNLKQTETGKKMFIRMLESVKSTGDKELQAFLEEVLEVYEKHNINGHIKWNKK